VKRNKGRMVQACYATSMRFILQQMRMQSSVVYHLHAAHCEARSAEARTREGRSTGHNLEAVRSRARICVKDCIINLHTFPSRRLPHILRHLRN